MAALHHIFAFVLFSTVVVEHILLRPKLSVDQLKRLRIVDAVYGVSALGLLAAGFARVLWFEKGSPFYFQSSSFWIKIILFVIVGLLSIYPTVQFIRWGHRAKLDPQFQVPKTSYRALIWIVRIELLLLLLILFFAAFMARGL